MQTIQKRERLPIIYHQAAVKQSYASVNVQIKGTNPYRYHTTLASVPDPPDPQVFGLLDPDPDPLVRGMDPDPTPDPDPSIIMQK
jgi:hypothetical protein